MVESFGDHSHQPQVREMSFSGKMMAAQNQNNELKTFKQHKKSDGNLLGTKLKTQR